MRTQKKHQLQQLRRWRIRKKVSGTKDCPRMAVCFSSENIHVQFIDDEAGKTLAAVSTVGKSSPPQRICRQKCERRQNHWRALRQKNALDKGIKQVVFDRGGKLYHGKVKALADAAREAGLKF